MEIYLYLLVIIFILLLYFNKSSMEYFTAINSYKMDLNKLKLFDFPDIPKIIELDNLPKCNIPIKYFYGYNQHYIWNDGEKVNIDILRQISRNYLIYNNETRFHLRAIRFEKSNILNNGKAYLLQIKLVHSGTSGLCDFGIIVPLEFSLTPELNILNKHDVPQYKCCSKKYGLVVKQELKQLSDILNKTIFKKYDINKTNHLLISQPIKISVDLGLDILDKLKSKGEDKISQESSWLEGNFMEI